MDATKLKVLNEVGYRIQESCGLCRHFDAKHGSAFGVCTRYGYVHEKHTGPARNLSVHVNGCCADGFTPDEVTSVRLGGFADLMERK